MKDKRKKNQKGSIILYATVLMMGASAIALTLSFVVLISVRMSDNFSNMINAYSAAETGLEKSLYEIKANKQDKSAGMEDTLTEVDVFSGTLTNAESSYSVDADNDKVDTLTFDLKKGQSKQIDLFNEEDGSSIMPTGPGTIFMSWTTSGCSVQAAEFGVKSFTKGTAAPSIISPEDFIVTLPSGSPYDYALLEDMSHIVRLKSLGCDLNDVEMHLSAEGYINYPLPNYITIESEGVSGKTSIKLRADTIWKPPLSGIGDYVLFSEQSLNK
ncbi:MAG: pilus assembly PilX N-terminal domain-containing protein [Patescibacteria group bacterium]|jgi:hypothetical protein